MSKNPVKLYVDGYLQLKTPPSEILKLSDFELDKLFHPPQTAPVNWRIQQLYDFFPEMEKQLRKRGVTVGMLYRKFKQEHPEAYAETSFFRVLCSVEEKSKPLDAY